MLMMVLTKRINSVDDQETEMMDHHKDQMENKDHHRDHLKDLLEDLVEDLKVLMDSHKVQAADQDSQDHQVAQVEDQADLYQKDLDLQEDQEHKADQVVQAVQAAHPADKEVDQADQFLKVDQVVLQADLVDSQVADPVHDQAHQVKMDQMVKDQQVVDQDLVLDLQVVKTVPADDQAHDPVHPVVKKVVPVVDPDLMDDQDQALTLEKVRNKCLKEC